MADYRLELPNSDPIMVRANNRAQAIRYATHKLVKIEILTTDEAIRLAKLGQELHDATGEPETEADAQPQLLEPPQGQESEGNAGDAPAAEDATTQGAAKSGASGRSGTSGTGKDKGE